MELSRIVVADWETHPIYPRPEYPPKPVGLAIWTLKQKPFYHAFGHPTENNSSLEEAKRHLVGLIREGYVVVWHHAGFDLDVAETHAGIKWPAEHHDTLILAFLNDPRARTFSLKPQAELHLGEPPTEQNALYDYVMEQVALKNPVFQGKHDLSKPNAWATRKSAGAYIAYCPGKLVGSYACGDVTRTGRLFKFFAKAVLSDPRQREAYDRERKFTRVLIKMERRGIPVATRALQRDIPIYRRRLKGIERRLMDRLKVAKSKREDFTWSGENFANQLERAGVIKEWILTEKEGRSTSVDSLREVGVDSKLVDELEVRAQIATCLGTFMENWVAQGEKHEDRFYARFNQVRQDYHGGGKLIGTETGRLSMTPNLQNATRGDKDERVPVVRSYIVPGRMLNGKKYRTGEISINKRDYKQQELKILAHEEGRFADENPQLILPHTKADTFWARYSKNPDMDAHNVVREMIHTIVQMLLERRYVKDLNFGLIYGMGVPKLALKIEKDIREARILYNAHMKALPIVKKFKEWLRDQSREDKPIYTWGGRKYFTEKPKMIGNRWMDFWYKLLNIIVQGGAADSTKRAMLRYHEMGYDDQWPLILQVHDELLTLSLEKDHLRAHRALNKAMLDMPELTLPMLSDGFFSTRSWADTKKHEVRV